MAGFALLSADGLTSYTFNRALPNGWLPPRWHVWKQEPTDTATDQSPIYGRYSEVLWDLAYERGIPESQALLFSSLRALNGDIRFVTFHKRLNAWVSCRGKVDLYLGESIHTARARAYGLTVTFTKVEILP